MTKKNIQKNLKLSYDFNVYVVRHPEMLKGISSSACIVMGSFRQPELTKKNKKMASKITKDKKKKCYQAMRIKNGWSIAQIQ